MTAVPRPVLDDPKDVECAIDVDRRQVRQTWLGHKRIDETMLYVHVAEAHPRELPEHVQQAARTEGDPDRRILAMLAMLAEPELEVRAGGLEP